MTDPFVHDDAAYVLGLLDDAERAAFEAHLATCSACRARVAEIDSLPALLASVPADEVDDQVPHTLLPRLLREVAVSQTRRRRLTGALGALVAACLVTIAVLAWPSATHHSTPNAAPRPMTAIAASAVSATVQLDARAWGTEITLDCRYAAAHQPAYVYGLVVIDSDGTRYQLGSWSLAPGGETQFRSGTWLTPAQIAKVQITVSGTAILTT